MKSNGIPLSIITTISSKPTLPPNFAMKIIEQEIQLEKTWSKELIGELVELYSQAIEFYNYNNDPKCYDYQDRMHKMLLRPQVISSLSSNPKTKSEPTPSSVNDYKEEMNKSRLLMAAELNSSMPLTSHKTERNISKTIDENENAAKEIVEKLVDNFKMQDTDLMSRLEDRRKMNKTFQYEPVKDELSISINYENISNIIESDKSGGYNVNKAELNKKIEELMEKHFAEKAARISEINVKYEKEIIEMQDEGVMALVIAQMRENMKEEIETVSKEYDAKRRAEILKLKQDYQ